MPNKSPIKVIIDTNLWISFLIGKQLASLKSLLVEQTIKPIFLNNYSMQLTLLPKDQN